MTLPLVDSEDMRGRKDVDVNALVLDWQSGLCLRPLSGKYGISIATAKKYLNDEGIDTSRRECLQPKTVELIKSINTVLEMYDKMTVRQIFYQLATKGEIPLSQKGYGVVSRTVAKGRRSGYISWNKIVDRIRTPRQIPMWNDVSEYRDTIINSYRKDAWLNQPVYFEVWFEKMALYDIFADILMAYGIVIQPLMGYASLTTVYDAAAKRFSNYNDRDCSIYYFGDHDASGVDIERAFRKEFKEPYIKIMLDNKDINIERFALNYEDIEKYNILPNIFKPKDRRLPNYISMGYEVQAEIDALPPDVLKERIESVLDNLDYEAYKEYKKVEAEESEDIKRRFMLE